MNAVPNSGAESSSLSYFHSAIARAVASIDKRRIAGHRALPVD